MPRSWDTSVTSSSGSRSLREPRNAYAGYLAWRARVSEVSVVIPTMNEEASIGRVIDEVRKALGGRLLETLVVDTDSRDRTREIATAKGARVISEPRRGYGRAYQTGFREARGTYLATLDADLTYPADRLPDFLAALESGRADFVSGERLSHLAGGAMSGMHRIGNAILNAAFHLLFRAPIRDSQSGMWAFRRAALSQMRLVHEGMAFSEEIKIEALRVGLRFLEIPVDYRVRVGDRKIRSMSDAMKNFVWLVRKRFGWHPAPHRSFGQDLGEFLPLPDEAARVERPVDVSVEGLVESRVDVRGQQLPGLPMLHRFPRPAALEVDVVRPVVLPPDADGPELHREFVYDAGEQHGFLLRHRQFVPLAQPRRILDPQRGQAFRGGERGVRLVQ